GLGSQRDPKVIAPLIAAVGSPEVDVRAAAADALERLSGQKFRYDVVKWTQWQKEQTGSSLIKKEDNSDKSPGDEYAPAKNPEVDAVDIAVVFDTTASMTHIWPQLSQAIDNVVGALVKNTPSLRLASIKYRADNPERSLSYTIKAKPLTRKHDEIR